MHGQIFPWILMYGMNLDSMENGCLISLVVLTLQVQLLFQSMARKANNQCSLALWVSSSILSDKLPSVFIPVNSSSCLWADPAGKFLSQSRSHAPDQGWGLSQFHYIPFFIPGLSEHWLPTKYHVHMGQVSPQLHRGSACQIWMWISGSNLCVC